MITIAGGLGRGGCKSGFEEISLAALSFVMEAIWQICQILLKGYRFNLPFYTTDNVLFFLSQRSSV